MNFHRVFTLSLGFEEFLRPFCNECDISILYFWPKPSHQFPVNGTCLFFDVGVIRLLVLVPLIYNDILVLLQAIFQDKPLMEQ